METRPEINTRKLISSYFLEGKRDLVMEMDKARLSAASPEEAWVLVEGLAARDEMSEPEVPSNVIPFDRPTLRK